MKTINKIGALVLMMSLLTCPLSSAFDMQQEVENFFSIFGGCGPNCRERNAKKEYQEYQERIRQYNQQIAEENKRITLHNKKAELHNKAIKIFKHVDTMLGGQYYHMNAYYKAAMDVFLKPEQEYLAQSEEVIQKAWDSVQHLNGLLLDENQRKNNLSNNGERLRNKFLEMFRKSDKYIQITHIMLKAIAEGNFANDTKKQAQKILTAATHNKLNATDLAAAVAKLIGTGLPTYGEHEEFCARLSWLCGFLLAGVKEKIVCSARGVCGVMNGAVAAVSGASQNMEAVHDSLIGGFDKVRTASDVLRVISLKDSYIGTAYVNDGPVSENIRAVDGGKKGAERMFDFFAKGNKVRGLYDPNTNESKKKIVLSDTTVITFDPGTEKGESVITISHIPSWILSEDVVLRFEHEHHVNDFQSDTEELKAARQKIYETLSTEEQQKLDELLKP